MRPDVSLSRGGTTAPSVLSSQLKISLRDVNLLFHSTNGQPVPTLHDINLDVTGGELISLVGPSGCGKTTLLNIVAGLLEPTSGLVSIDGHVVSGIQSNIGYMPARDALLPWRTAIQNVEYGLEIKKVPGRRRIALKALASVGLSGFENHYWSELSQGMRQRVAVARTFASSPEILLMDEPFSAVDAQTRVLMQELFLELWERERKTVILVTHDVTEAIALSDRVVVLSKRPARIKSVIPISLRRPRRVRELYQRPDFQALMARVWDELGYDNDLGASDA